MLPKNEIQIIKKVFDFIYKNRDNEHIDIFLNFVLLINIILVWIIIQWNKFINMFTCFNETLHDVIIIMFYNI